MTADTQDGPIAQSISIGFRAVAIGVLVLSVAWAVSNWRQVQPESQAVVLQFGRIARVQQAGLTVAWPRPMGEVVLVPGRDQLLTLRTVTPVRLGALQDVYTDASGVLVSPGAGSYLTGDGGVVLLAATLSYQVSDPAAYFVARDHVEPALQRVFEAASVQLAATRTLDDFLVARSATAGVAARLQDRREALRGDLMNAMNARLEQVPLGVTVSRVDLDPALPPGARIAFDGVLVAEQLAEQAVASARTQATQSFQAAERERDQVLTEARANAAERVGAARVRTASISAVQASFTADARPAMLEQLYREQIAEIMHRVGKVVAVDRQGGRVIIPAELGQHAMSASIALGAPRPLLARLERGMLGLRLTLAMFAAGLLVLAVLWQVVFPEQRILSDLVAGVAALLVAVPVIGAAWDSLRHPSLHGVTDRLIAVALVAAWASGDLMTAAVLPIIMILGHVLEERSLLGSNEAIQALTRLTETTARRIEPGGGVSVVPAGSLQLGDLIELLPGSRVPADGIVRSGEAGLDTASLTGESVPVDVGPGDAALAGSINTNGRLELEITRLGAETTLGKIIALMRTAERAKPPVARLLERYAGHYLALVLMIAAGTWLASGDTAATLAVLVASCPCALVLAAPATSIAAISVAARHGILIKGAAFLEQLAEVNAVVFDKTGTLTTGELSLAEVQAVAGVDPVRAVAIAAALGTASTHPVSRAAARAVPQRDRLAPSQVRESGGSGITAVIEGDEAALGRPDLFRALGIATPPVPAHDGPIAGVSIAGRFLGWLLFADQKRPEAREATQALQALGLHRQVLLTGDRRAVATRIAAELGIDDVDADVLPEAKMHRVMAEIDAGFRPMVVGDGINDSLALKAGAVGVAMGAQGTDVALASADLVLMTSDLRRLATAIRLSRRCRRTIHVNVAIGLGWTAALVALAAAGVLGAEGAIIAALLHNFSTFVGLGNAGRLLLFDEIGSAARAA